MTEAQLKILQGCKSSLIASKNFKIILKDLNESGGFENSEGSWQISNDDNRAVALLPSFISVKVRYQIIIDSLTVFPFTMSEKLCLQWNDFKENAIGAFGNLRDDHDFADVTLATEDGRQVEAHKVILASSSPFFQNLLKRNRHPHPLIYLRGVRSDDLLAIVDFLYCGEANVYQENLDSFLAIAEELQLKGLMGKANAGDEVVKTETVEMPISKKVNQINKKFTNISKDSSVFQTKSNEEILSKVDGAVALTSYFSGDFQELDEKCHSMMEKTSNRHTNGQLLCRCKICGKEDRDTNLKNHIEINHLEGVSIPCNFCEKTFRSRHSQTMHIGRNHKI